MTQTIAPPPISAKRHVARGTAWMVGVRWAIRLTGLLSTVVLARLLTPADYGIVAIATLILGTIEVLGEVGVSSAVIRHPDPTREHYDSAWTMLLLVGLLLALVVLATTPLTVTYFHEPRAKLVLTVLALRTAMTGFQNIASIKFQHDLEFHKLFQLNVGSTIVQFVAVMISAFLLRNYWALVIGIMSKQVATIVLSYILEPYRPRFSLAKASELVAFSLWVLLRNIGSYVLSQVDKIAIGGFGGAVAMGRYDVGRDVATSPVSEVVLPLVYALYPTMAKVQHDREKRRELFFGVFHWSALISTALAVGVALVSQDMATVILGPKWDGVSRLMPWLALSFGLTGLTSSVYTAFESLGRADLSARLQWMRVFAYSIAIFPVAFYFRNLEAVAIARFCITVAVCPTLFYALSKALDVPFRNFLFVLWRPFTAGLVMACAVLGMNAAIGFVGILRLMLDVLAGASVFVASVMVLWLAIGSPDGPEREIVTMARRGLSFLFSWGTLAKQRRPTTAGPRAADPSHGDGHGVMPIDQALPTRQPAGDTEIT